MGIPYTGIEEAVEIAGSLGISDFKSAFLFLKQKTGQLFPQLFCEETKKPVYYRDSDILYCGQLRPDSTYDEILEMVNRAVRTNEEDEKYADWLEEHGFFRNREEVR